MFHSVEVLTLFPFGISKGSGNVYGITFDSSVFVAEEGCENVMLAFISKSIMAGKTRNFLFRSMKTIIVNLFICVKYMHSL